MWNIPGGPHACKRQWGNNKEKKDGFDFLQSLPITGSLLSRNNKRASFTYKHKLKVNLVTLCEKSWNREEMTNAPEAAWSLLRGRMCSHEEQCWCWRRTFLTQTSRGIPLEQKGKIANQLCLLIKSPSPHNSSLWESLTKNFPNQWRQIFWSSLSNHMRTWVPKPIILGETETCKLRTSPSCFVTPPTRKFPVSCCLQPPPGLSRSYPVQRTTREISRLPQ